MMNDAKHWRADNGYAPAISPKDEIGVFSCLKVLPEGSRFLDNLSSEEHVAGGNQTVSFFENNWASLM